MQALELVSWVDLPDDDFELILGYKSNNVAKLNKLTKAYHQLDKTDINNLQLRIDRLEDLIEFIENWLSNNLTTQDKPKHLYTLKDIACKKVHYLLSLIRLSNIESLPEFLSKYLSDVSKLKDPNNKVLYLNKLRMYSIQKNEYWGDFVWVLLDPCKRQLTNYLQMWEQIRQDSVISLDFFLWLENKYVPKFQPTERFLTADELKDCLVVVNNGKLTAKNSLAHFSSTNEKYLFVMDLDHKLYISAETNGMSHACFTRAKPVLMAGKIAVENGIIKYVSFESGHYIPSIQHGYQFFHILLDQGYEFAQPVNVGYFSDRNKYYVLANKSDLQNFSRFSEVLEQNRISCFNSKMQVEDVKSI